MSLDVDGSFVGEKIAKIRWVTATSGVTGFADGPADHFITGSWDNDNTDPSNQSRVSLYSLASQGDGDADADGPKLLSSYSLDGDVTEIKKIQCGETAFAVSTSTGGVTLVSTSRYDLNAPLKKINSWEGLHRFSDDSPSPCTCLAVMDSEIVTVGEDGRMNFLSAHQDRVIKTIDNADSCSLHSVCFLKHNQVITGNLRGQMKIWDLRASNGNPSNTFLLSGDRVAATSLAHHPTQRHLVLAGSENGALAVWDLRVNTYPASLLNAHSGAVLEIQFHPDHPQRLFTCSAAGELWHWNTSTMSKPITNFTAMSHNESAINPWLMNDDDKSSMEVASLLSTLHKPINSLDCNKNRVICGCDNEALYIIKNVYID